MSMSAKPEVAAADTDTISELREIPLNWAAECDEQLVQFLSETIEINSLNLGTIKNFVDQVTVSTSTVSSLSSLCIFFFCIIESTVRNC